MIRLRLLVGRHSLQANLASMLLGFAMFGSFTLVSSFVQTPPSAGYGFGGSVLDVGLYALPSTVTMLAAPSWPAACPPVSARPTPSPRRGCAPGRAPVVHPLQRLGSPSLGSNAMQGVGFGVGFAALGTLAVQHVPMDQSGIASGINSLVRTIGGSVSGAVTAALLTSITIAGTPVPSRHAYVLSFAIITASAVGSAVVALVSGMMAREVSGVG